MQANTMFFKIVCALLCAGVFGGEEEVGYQYTTFTGPVSGEAAEVPVAGPQERGEAAKSFDYVAKPDYVFAYGVDDPETGNNQKHEETRDGDVVTGEYSVVDPDGSMRTVYYTADPINGFQATIEKTPPIPGYRSAYEQRESERQSQKQQHQYSVREPSQEVGQPAYYDYDDGSRSTSYNRDRPASYNGGRASSESYPQGQYISGSSQDMEYRRYDEQASPSPTAYSNTANSF